MCGAWRATLHDPRNSTGSQATNILIFSNSDFGLPSLSTYSSLRDPNPTTMPRLNRHSVEASATVSQDIPMSRDFSVMPGSCRRQRSISHSTHSSCFGNSRNGMIAGSLRSTLRGSNLVMPQSMNFGRMIPVVKLQLPHR